MKQFNEIHQGTRQEIISLINERALNRKDLFSLDQLPSMDKELQGKMDADTFMSLGIKLGEIVIEIFGKGNWVYHNDGFPYVFIPIESENHGAHFYAYDYISTLSENPEIPLEDTIKPFHHLVSNAEVLPFLQENTDYEIPDYNGTIRKIDL
ncbi:hypothetical protein IMZ31_22375 (plasmid) [Pontibacillus sp. ALD_SL1]|uniref:hypothetical protein n=1 Tax=Pontibacillus sp. ALD_SL1 TaxID=2777185 RepID=UPI001A96ECFE|nr:hypothetical protein [Pontibacillus sp. ALD_SL1]QST02202.1 hypothetical protein IMZ31_22375 [Pontibacillus sp. ALD_SL1]